jgi:hypothetical protein
MHQRRLTSCTCTLQVSQNTCTHLRTPCLPSADRTMVQSADSNSRAGSVIGRFPDLAGKRALVTGDMAPWMIYIQSTRLDLPQTLLSALEFCAPLLFELIFVAIHAPRCKTVLTCPAVPWSRSSRSHTGCFTLQHLAMPLQCTCRRLSRHRPRRDAGTERQRRHCDGAGAPQRPPGRGCEGFAPGSALLRWQVRRCMRVLRSRARAACGLFCFNIMGSPVQIARLWLGMQEPCI